MKNFNFLQKFGTALGLAFMSSQSVATDYNLNGTGVFDSSEGIYYYNASSSIDVVSMFDDVFTFTAPEGNSWSFQAEASNLGGDDLYKFTDISFQEYTGEATTYFAEIGGGSMWGWVTDSSKDNIIIEPGEYSIFVSGISTVVNADYNMDITLSAISPVPEPSSIVLMLGGLGLVGFMATRRKQS